MPAAVVRTTYCPCHCVCTCMLVLYIPTSVIRVKQLRGHVQGRATKLTHSLRALIHSFDIQGPAAKFIIITYRYLHKIGINTLTHTHTCNFSWHTYAFTQIRVYPYIHPSDIHIREQKHSLTQCWQYILHTFIYICAT